MTNIREAQLEDSEAIAEAHVTAWRESYRDLIPETRLYERFGARCAVDRVEHRPECDLVEVGYIWSDLKPIISN